MLEKYTSSASKTIVRNCCLSRKNLFKAYRLFMPYVYRQTNRRRSLLIIYKRRKRYQHWGNQQTFYMTLMWPLRKRALLNLSLPPSIFKNYISTAICIATMISSGIFLDVYFAYNKLFRFLDLKKTLV